MVKGDTDTKKPVSFAAIRSSDKVTASKIESKSGGQSISKSFACLAKSWSPKQCVDLVSETSPIILCAFGKLR